ncbi:MAG: tetratricopeptide repeat protein [Pseudomonadota bacterium]
MSAKFSGLFLFVLLMLPLMPAAGAGLDDADERLFKVQLAMAEKGDSRAQYFLGEMHEQGLGTRQDVDEAFKWYAKAAEQGDPWAKRKLANRKEIMDEIKQQQEAENPGNAVSPATPENAVKPGGGATPAKPAAVARADQARLEQERIKKAAAEREKRRAMVRAMVLERMRNPVGGLFE